MVTRKVYFDISINGVNSGRIIIGLFGRTVPISVRNFAELCTGQNGVSKYSGKELNYRQTWFHKIMLNQYAVGGDIVSNNG